MCSQCNTKAVIIGYIGDHLLTLATQDEYESKPLWQKGEIGLVWEDDPDFILPGDPFAYENYAFAISDLIKFPFTFDVLLTGYTYMYNLSEQIPNWEDGQNVTPITFTAARIKECIKAIQEDGQIIFQLNPVPDSSMLGSPLEEKVTEGLKIINSWAKPN